jgi:4-hydroxy-tetrahydrodipicolinate synthase/2-dehydro-3-deoxy-phosphogluconate/2-dehydro-3-deoxy-6-phosphogalactonate aldolase
MASQTNSEQQESVAGVIPPIITAFNKDEEINYEATAAHARFVVNRGVQGVFPLGTNGEFPMLKPEERANVIDAVVGEVGDEVPVIAGVSAPSTRNTVSYALDAEENGADAVVVGIPYYYPIGSEAIVDHYVRVAGAVSIPVYIYHFPARMGNKLELDTLDRLASIEGIVGVKDSSGDVGWLGQAIDRNPDLTYLAGLDVLLFAELEIGCTGLVSAVSNVFPEMAVDLYEAYVNGDDERARELQSVVFDVWAALDTGPYLGGVKSALDLHPEATFQPGPMRTPLRRMDETGEERLAETLQRLNLF